MVVIMGPAERRDLLSFSSFPDGIDAVPSDKITLMGRLHLIEIEDQPWCPRFLRDGATEFLAFAENISHQPYVHFVETIKEAMIVSKTHELVDLCSGAGGPLPMISRMLEETNYPVSVTLTDLHPSSRHFDQLTEMYHNFTAVKQPVDARQIPSQLQGMRILCESFHHFRPSDAQRILQDAVDQGSPIAILELVARRPASFLCVLLSPLMVMIGALFIRPFLWTRALFCLLIPLIPLLILFDGIVSCFRIYSPEELQALVDELDHGERYEWRIEQRRFGPGWTTTLVGWPRRELESRDFQDATSGVD